MDANAQQSTKLDRQAKLSLAFLAIFGCFILYYGWQKIGAGINSPFLSTNTNTVASAGTNNPAKTDSDKDGLTDQEESDIYGTSPYQPDTDGDGKIDRQEILAGTDPLCPEGKDCTNKVAVTTNVNQNINSNSSASGINSNSSNSVDVSDVNIEAAVNASGIIASSNTNSSTSSNSNTSGLPTPDEIRNILKQGGVSSQLLDKVSDQQLVALYLESVDQLTNSGALDTAEVAVNSALSGGSTTALSPERVRAMTGGELRTYLKSAGFTDADMKDFTDTELRSLVLESLQQTK